jgi:hypothetical protein
VFFPLITQDDLTRDQEKSCDLFPDLTCGGFFEPASPDPFADGKPNPEAPSCGQTHDGQTPNQTPNQTRDCKRAGPQEEPHHHSSVGKVWVQPSEGQALWAPTDRARDDDRMTLYTTLLHTKRHEEERRDDINRYYTSLFTGILSVIPLLDRLLPDVAKRAMKIHNYKVFVMLLAMIGMGISINWMLTLLRMVHYASGLEALLIEMEPQVGLSFIGYMHTYLAQTHTPRRVTRQSMFIPALFFIIFVLILLYSLDIFSW